MNIVYMIGNGFDINLGLKTRYCDFYKYYESIISPSSLVKALKAEISSEIENWSDLELAFGIHTSKLNTLEEFDEVLDDLIDNLGDYLESEESDLEINNLDTQKFLVDLYSPELYLVEEDSAEVSEYKKKSNSGQWNVNIITLNYTRTIERVLKDNFTNVIIGSYSNGRQVLLENVQHIHGYTDKRTILGVNDLSQVGQVNFHNNQEILEALIKTSYNRSQRHNIDKKCEKYILDADLICIFGSSLGDTDNYWWNFIGEQLRRGIKLIIFVKGEQIKPRFAHKQLRDQRRIKQYFLDKTDLSDEEKTDFYNNIYIGANTEMFSLANNK